MKTFHVILVLILYFTSNTLGISYFVDSQSGTDNPQCGNNNSCKSLRQAILNFRTNFPPQNSNSTIAEELHLFLHPGYYKGDDNRGLDISQLNIQIQPFTDTSPVTIQALDDEPYPLPIFFLSDSSLPTILTLSYITIDSLQYRYLLEVEQSGVVEGFVNVLILNCIIEYTRSTLIKITSNAFSYNTIRIIDTQIVGIDQLTTANYIFNLKLMKSIEFDNLYIFGNSITGIATMELPSSFICKDTFISENNYRSNNPPFSFNGGGNIEFNNNTFSKLMMQTDNLNEEKVAAIYVNGADNLKIIDCIFDYLDGRALFLIDTNHTIKGSTFSNSYYNGQGSVLLSKATTHSVGPKLPSKRTTVVNSIESSTFSNINDQLYNPSYDYEISKSTVIYLQDNSNTIIKNSSFTNNYLGAITTISSPLKISKSIFKNNIGSIFCDTRELNFLDSTSIFTNNSDIKTNKTSFDVKTTQGILCRNDYDSVTYEGCHATGPTPIVDEINIACGKEESSEGAATLASEKKKTGIIVGSVIGGVALLSIIIGLSIFFYKKNKDPYNGDINPKHRNKEKYRNEEIELDNNNTTNNYNNNNNNNNININYRSETDIGD